MDPSDLMGGFGVLPSFLKWATFGLWPGRNCVTAIVDCLRKSGIDAPRRLTTPDQLFDWATRDRHDADRPKEPPDVVQD